MRIDNPLIDDKGYCIYCRGTRVKYSCGRTQFTETCLNPACGRKYRVDVTFGVHKKITTVEGFRTWVNNLSL